jgi:hypothetical protein
MTFYYPNPITYDSYNPTTLEEEGDMTQNLAVCPQ